MVLVIVLEEKAVHLNFKEFIMEEKDITNRRIQELEIFVEELKTQVKELKKELAEKDKLINSVYSSKTWKILRLYDRYIGKESFLGKLFTSLTNSINFKNKTDVSNEEILYITDRHYSQINSFIKNNSSKKGFFIIFADPKIINEFKYRGDRFSHRAIHLIREFEKNDYGIIYVYSEKNENLDRVDVVSKSIIQLNLDLFITDSIYKYIIDKISEKFVKKIFLIQFLCDEIPKVLDYVNSLNWLTIYDVIDNWEEFYKEGWINWYSKDIEEYIAKNVKILISVSHLLQKKFSNFNKFYLIPNGYYPYKLYDKGVKKLKKGKITLGYVGNLQKYRFNWPLLLQLAEKNKDWIFYLIGRMTEDIKLPENIILLGFIKPHIISAYARNWDVGIIPFKINNLTISCDNLKVYEYLYWGLPVVASGIGYHMKEYPFVFVAENERDFEEYIKKAFTIKFNKDQISDFLESAKWSNRANEVLRIIDEN